MSAPAASVTWYPVSRIDLRYATPHPSSPDLDALADVTVPLRATADGWALAQAGEAADQTLSAGVALDEFSAAPARLSVGVIAEMTSRLRDALADRSGLLGHFVVPDPVQIDPDTGQDLRPEGNDGLTILVYLASVGDTRTIGFGDRLPPDANTINNPIHERIARAIPLEEGQLLTRPPLDLSLARLNRHPGRRVEAAVAPTAEPGEISLDYLISESKPWTVFAQVANTGTQSTDELRYLFGATHRQLTGADDTLSVRYVTAEFDQANAVSARYLRPLNDLNTARIHFDFAWNEYTASDVNLGLTAIDGDGLDFGIGYAQELAHIGGGFLDAVAGLRYRDIRVNNLLAGTDGKDQLLLASIGVAYERQTNTARTDALATVETNLSGIAGTSESELALLGREGADAEFTVLRLDAAHTFFLEPVFDPDGFAGRRGPDAQTLAHSLTTAVRTQWTPGKRLVANEQVIGGGLFTVRGYEEAIASGDNAVLATIEYRFGLSSALSAAERPGTAFGRTFRARRQEPYGRADWDVGFRAFLDYAFIDNNDVRSFESDENLVGVGVGIDVRLYTNISARADLGVALSDASSQTNPSDAGDTRLHFLVVVSY